MRLKGLLSPLTENMNFKQILKNINLNNYPLEIHGISDSGKSYLIDNLFESIEKSVLILTNSDIEARKLYEDLSLYTTNVYYLPSKEIVFYDIYAISGDLRWERLKVINEILNNDKKIIVTCIESLSAYYIPVELYKKYTFDLSVGDTAKIDKIQELLVKGGYERVELVENKGEFSIRGGIVDIYTPISSEPYRIEFFGDEIDSIRNFNVESQRSIEKVNKIKVFPAKEVILEKKNIDRGYENIKKDLKFILGKLDKDQIQKEKITKNTKQKLESLNENWGFEAIDSFIPYFYERLDTLLDYTKDYLVIVDGIKRCLGKLDSVNLEFIQNYNNFLSKGDILPQQAKLIIDKDELIDLLKEERIITVEAIENSIKEFKPANKFNFSQLTLQSYHGQVDMLIEDIKRKKEQGFKTVILSGTRSRGERLAKSLQEMGIEVFYKDVIREIDDGEVFVTFGEQITGFEYPDLKLCLISDKEIFGQFKKRKKRKHDKKGTQKIKSFTELKPGDYVVHSNHGIGVFKGIKQLEVQGHKKDYLEISYDSDDKLYVPVEQLDLVQRYIGSESKTPKINKLGTSEWAKTKRKVKKSIEEMAEDLVKLYAVRSTLKGYKFSKDTVWQKQFEDEFPYEETPDQISAVEDIKSDMETTKVMDRLLCGDVGYGKTEVAIRAAFKSIMDGKQVAFLVPTTILAQQHYSNFKKRFSGFPVEIDVISRFRTVAQQKDTIKKVKEGNVDILIGTHRILQKDINFKDLGLLIVDEEQRFGVSHKEKIKKLKKNVDVLTLSATPIPRTLHMSLVGVRDISVIETPPEERYPVQTYVVEYNDQLIRDAILREISRGGQIYFVYNRVEHIHEMASAISKLIPEAKVAIAHGQMKEKQLEGIILDFTDKKYDILISTTIIETGMDIQNVNTMIIYDADKMGLSQLYQLRGRVGRTNRMAYCYLTYRKDKILTEVAEKRLKAIKDFTELGSGFKIALKDLEIRGAGNMMGSAQHGHMASIGYDLYCKMLQDTIKLVKGEIEREPIETSVELKVDAYIPSTYIKDETQKIEIYKKIAAIDSKEELMDVEEEIEDRFSDIPNSVYNLINVAYIKSLGKKLGIESIKERGQEVIFQFENKDRLSQKLISSILDKHSNKVAFKLKEKIAIGYKIKDIKRENLFLTLKEFLEYMVENND
ncbi:transcription-repair coupling factor [Clostridium niameyense]|uniref:Transcription-repair-coupling factor n=1 Tax=Clostridium niameyense TaxID=1622073 RepID=A0A6M0RDL6_9CLOT|nr:transcription-repair coupling factor [Clostridium niameyense]NEZ47679.1 transcription-repair coupling factor [Clostridium niameyense]